MAAKKKIDSIEELAALTQSEFLGMDARMDRLEQKVDDGFKAVVDTLDIMRQDVHDIKVTLVRSSAGARAGAFGVEDAVLPQRGGTHVNRVIAVSAALMVVALLVSQALAAQHQPGRPMPMGGQPQSQEQPGMGPGMGGPGMMPPMQRHMMEHMRMHHMMGGMMGPMSMMGPMGPMGMGMMGAEKDPKAFGRMLQLRGEMLKAIGEVLLKHGKAMAEEAQ